MANKEITIWVYDDECVSELSVKSALATVQKNCHQTLLQLYEPFLAKTFLIISSTASRKVEAF